MRRNNTLKTILFVLVAAIPAVAMVWMSIAASRKSTVHMDGGTGLIPVGMALVLVVAYSAVSVLVSLHKARRIKAQGMEMEAMVVDCEQVRYFLVLRARVYHYHPRLVYLIGDRQVRVTALNHLRKPLPAGTLCTVKVWGLEPGKVVLADTLVYSKGDAVLLAVTLATCLLLLAKGFLALLPLLLS